jgi:hypothetical protein
MGSCWSYGSMWVLMRPCCLIWVLMGLSGSDGSRRVLMDPYGFTSVLMGPGWSWWVLLGRFGFDGS